MPLNEFDPNTAIRQNVAWGIEGMGHRSEITALYEHALGCEMAIEIGSYKGMSTAVLAAAVGDGGRVYAISDWNSDVFGRPEPGGEERYEEFWQNMIDRGLDEIVVPLNGRSEVIAAEWIGEVEFLYVDGDHRADAFMRDLKQWVPFVQKRIALHDVDCPGISKVLPGALETHLGRFEVVQKVDHMLLLEARS